MHNLSKKHLIIPLLLLVSLGGCKKKTDSDKKSSFSKTHMKKSKSSSKSAQAFDLDDDAMNTFALDDKLEHHQKSSSARTQKSADNKLFSWEDAAVDETKHMFQKLHFEFDKDILKSNEQGALKHNIEQAKKMIKSGKTIVIEGHACHSAGSAIYNMALSERRARHVAQKFAEAGIDSSNIRIVGRGQEMPIRKGGSRDEQAVNRRVEIYAIDAQ